MRTPAPGSSGTVPSMARASSFSAAPSSHPSIATRPRKPSGAASGVQRTSECFRGFNGARLPDVVAALCTSRGNGPPAPASSSVSATDSICRIARPRTARTAISRTSISVFTGSTAATPAARTIQGRQIYTTAAEAVHRRTDPQRVGRSGRSSAAHRDGCETGCWSQERAAKERFEFFERNLIRGTDHRPLGGSAGSSTNWSARHASRFRADAAE